MSDFGSLPSLPYLNNINNVFYTALETRPFRVECPKLEITHGSFGCTGTIPLCGPSRHCFIFFTTICSTSKNGGELRTEMYTSAAISVIHQAALEST